jgi:photosystem II stability/assembly factor-like uncharacterized protein
MASASDGFCVGNYGTILRWNGSAWSKLSNAPTSAILLGVAVRKNGDSIAGWAVGEEGVILRFTGSAWEHADSPTGARLEDVAMPSATEAWAVGQYGVIVHWGQTPLPGERPRGYLPLTRK